MFLTCNDTLKCLHEPFGFPYYYGPERLNDRFENDEQTRLDSGCSDETFKTVFDAIERENAEVGSLPSSFQPPIELTSPLAAFLISFGCRTPSLIYSRLCAPAVFYKSLDS